MRDGSHEGLSAAQWRELADAMDWARQPLQQMRDRWQANGMIMHLFWSLLLYNQQHDNAGALLAESYVYGILQGSSPFRQWLRERASKKGLVPANDRLIESVPPLLLERQGDALLISLNRAAQRNAYSAAMRDALYEALLLLQMDSSLKSCDIHALGDCFCVGGDLTEFGSGADAATAYRIRWQRNVAGLLLEQADRVRCHVHGACIGSGIELPACAGHVRARENAFFQLPELSMGLIPGAGGSVSILRRIGPYRLLGWFLSGRRISAGRALEWGLVDAIDG